MAKILFILFSLVSLLSHSQNVSILRGSVRDSNKKPLEGIECFLKNNTTVGAITGSLGIFNLQISKTFKKNPFLIRNWEGVL